MSEIRAQGVVPAPREQVFDFLAQLENHWVLADRWIEVVALESEPGGEFDRATVRVRGPLGLSRELRTRVVVGEPPHTLRGSAESGPRTRAAIVWSLAEEGEATRVGLAAEIEAMSAIDRLLWTLGGRNWMQRRFAAVVAGLGRRFARAGAASAAEPRPLSHRS